MAADGASPLDSGVSEGVSGLQSLNVVVSAGPLRIFGRSFVICTGVLLRMEENGLATPSSDDTLATLGSCVDVLFKVAPEGVTQADLNALVAGVPRDLGSHTTHRDTHGTTYGEASKLDRYPDSSGQSGGVEVRCTCERRELKLSRGGAIVLHATSLTGLSGGASTSKPVASMALSPKADRHDIFASWIMSTFGGPIGLKDGLIDVAGGKGRLSNAITALGVPCTLVDPFAGLGRDPIAGPHSGDGLDGSVGLLLNREVRCLKATLENAQALVPGLMSDCSAIVALHPDEATEPTVDAAYAAGRPFAVVPCCVFRKQFPGRLLRSGAAVVKYGNFLKFLREKDNRIRSFRLPFEGRNMVLYMTAADFDRPMVK